MEFPDFSGDEKGSPSPFHRIRLLCEKLDAAARMKIIGFENDYEEAMKRLEQYFGDTTKVVQCVVNQISENNYRGLVNYSTILEQNYNNTVEYGFGTRNIQSLHHVHHCQEVPLFH